MEPVTGGLVAALVAWASVVAAARLPVERWVADDDLRRVGSLSLALIAASVLGADIPHWLPPAFLVGGLVLARTAKQRLTRA